MKRNRVKGLSPEEWKAEALLKVSQPKPEGKSLNFYLKKHGVALFPQKRRGKKRKKKHSKRPRINSAVILLSPKERLIAEVARYGKTRREWYREVYLKSKHWKGLRRETFEIQGRKCRCGVTQNLDIHHLDYRSIFDVKPCDLIVLCRTCHEEEHNRQKNLH